MKNIQEKSLIKINENSIFYKIKSFFYRIFKKKRKEDRDIQYSNSDMQQESKKISFNEYVKNIDNEEIKILKLQKQYRNGEIKDDDLSMQQIQTLCELYDKQIERMKKSNEIKKKRLLEYKRIKES